MEILAPFLAALAAQAPAFISGVAALVLARLARIVPDVVPTPGPVPGPDSVDREINEFDAYLLKASSGLSKLDPLDRAALAGVRARLEVVLAQKQ